MWPWGHLAVGYLLFSLGCRTRNRRPDGPAVLLLAVGTQLPDLVDKPLAWTFGVLPNGRSLAHSVLVVTLVVGGAFLLVDRVANSDGRRTVGVVAFGAYSHLLSDAVAPANAAEPSNLAFLLWPALPPVDYDTRQSFLAHFTSMEPSPYFLAQLVLVGLAAVVWWRDGHPGVGTVRGLLADGRAATRR